MQFLFEAVNFDALKLQEVEKASLFGGTRVVSGKDPSGRTFGTCFFDLALALQIKIVEKLLAVRGEVIHAEENGALLHVDIVTGGPFHFGERRVGTIPLATGVGRAKRADAGISAAIAESFVETSDGVVIVGDRYRPNPPLPKVKWSARDNINMQQRADSWGPIRRKKRESRLR